MVLARPLPGKLSTLTAVSDFTAFGNREHDGSATTPSPECLQNEVPAGNETDPMGYFYQALATGQVANFNFIIPNGCEDGESNCDPIHNRCTQFDAFLAREIPLLSPAFPPNDVIIVTYDEDERAGGLAQKNGSCRQS